MTTKSNLTKRLIEVSAFTLVELLVVIAIISILAAIAVPKVSQFIDKGRAGKAVAEIANINTACTKLLTDAGKRDFRHMFVTPDPDGSVAINGTTYALTTVVAAQYVYTQAFYVLMKQGRNAQSDADWPVTTDGTTLALALADGVADKLGVTYFTELGKDPWGSLYQFYIGPWQPTTDYANILPPFLCYTIESDVPGSSVDPVFSDFPSCGYPTSRYETIYVYSKGLNLVSNQAFDSGWITADIDPDSDMVPGGDDINSWDKTQSWGRFY